MLADLAAPALLAPALYSAMLAYLATPTFLAVALFTTVLAYLAAPTFLAVALFTTVFADSKSAALLTKISEIYPTVLASAALLAMTPGAAVLADPVASALSAVAILTHALFTAVWADLVAAAFLALRLANPLCLREVKLMLCHCEELWSRVGMPWRVGVVSFGGRGQAGTVFRVGGRKHAAAGAFSVTRASRFSRRGTLLRSGSTTTRHSSGPLSYRQSSLLLQWVLRAQFLQLLGEATKGVKVFRLHGHCDLLLQAADRCFCLDSFLNSFSGRLLFLRIRGDCLFLCHAVDEYHCWDASRCVRRLR